MPKPSGLHLASAPIRLIHAASAIIQPLFGWLGDKRPTPWFMALGVFLAGLGMAGVGFASNYGGVMAAVTVCGIGVAMLHPEGGRLSNLAAGTRKSNGMSIFAVGGNIGFFAGPLLCAISVTAFGLPGTAVFLIPGTVCAAILLGFNRRFAALGARPAQAEAASSRTERWELLKHLHGKAALNAG